MRTPSSLLFCLALAAPPCSAGEIASRATAKNTIDDGRLRQAVEQVIYRLKPTARSSYQGVNPAQRLSVEFDIQGTRLQHPRGDVTFRLTGYGYGSRLRAPATAKPIANGAVVEYRRGDLTEWYLNEAGGLEQGFTLEQRAEAGREGEPLVIAMAVEGELRPKLAARGGAIVLESGGRGVLRYGGLRSWDARGRAVASRLEVHESEIRLVVEDRDAEYPLVVDPFWTQQAELVAPDGQQFSAFGNSVAVSGDTAVVGSPGSFGGTGAAYIFVRSGTIWTLQAELEVFSSGFAFGSSVAVQGNTAVIGAPQTFLGSGDEGAAFVFVRNGVNWTEQQELTATDFAGGDFFGASVAVEGNTIVVGAPDKTTGMNGAQGVAYVFVNNGVFWTQQQELIASDGAAGDAFGLSVSISGATAVIGAPGSQSSFAGVTGQMPVSGSRPRQAMPMSSGPGKAYTFVNGTRNHDGDWGARQGDGTGRGVCVCEQRDGLVPAAGVARLRRKPGRRVRRFRLGERGYSGIWDAF